MRRSRSSTGAEAACASSRPTPACARSRSRPATSRSAASCAGCCAATERYMRGWRAPPRWLSSFKRFCFRQLAGAQVPEIRLTRTIDFSTSLRYWNPALPAEENRRLFGARAAQHGHNYQLSVTLRGEPDPLTGMVMDVKDLQAILD